MEISKIKAFEELRSLMWEEYNFSFYTQAEKEWYTKIYGKENWKKMGFWKKLLYRGILGSIKRDKAEPQIKRRQSELFEDFFEEKLAGEQWKA